MSKTQYRVFLKDAWPLVGQFDVEHDENESKDKRASGTLTIRSLHAMEKMEFDGKIYDTGNPRIELFGPSPTVEGLKELVDDLYGDFLVIEDEPYQFGK